ncbi:MAG TPA: calcium-binding protein [Microvirga sp.]|nr:calcium-binding protein [Microvirga sp.]
MQFQVGAWSGGSSDDSSGGSQNDDELSDEELQQINAQITAQLFENINALIAQGGTEEGYTQEIADLVFDSLFGGLTGSGTGGSGSAGTDGGTSGGTNQIGVLRDYVPFGQRKSGSDWKPPTDWRSANPNIKNLPLNDYTGLVGGQTMYTLHRNPASNQWEMTLLGDPPVRVGLVRAPDGSYYWAPPDENGKFPKPGYKITLTVQDADGSSHTMDFFSGSSDDDLIVGSGFLNGDDGHDTINGGGQADVLKGGAGHDVLNGGAGDDLLQGGAGVNVLTGGEGFDTVSYEDATAGVTAWLSFSWSSDVFEGVEALSGSAFADNLGGDAGDNLLSGHDGNDSLYGALGNDTLSGGDGSDSLAGGDGNDTLQGGSGNDTLLGGVGVNSLDGGEGDDLFLDLSWTDSGTNAFQGGAGADIVSYQEANAGVAASLTGGGFGGEAAGDSYAGIEGLRGTGYDDVLISGVLAGGQGGALYGGGGNDQLYGQGGADLLKGEAGEDYLLGGLGNDTLSGGLGHDMLSGEAGNDTLVGEDGNDGVHGEGGDDAVYGGTGTDTLSGGTGRDVLTGGSEADLFVFDVALSAANADTITDFVVGADRIQLSGAIFTGLTASSLAAAFTLGPVATAAQQRLVYNQATGELFWDADGSGGQAAVKFAAVTAGLSLSASDFLVV